MTYEPKHRREPEECTTDEWEEGRVNAEFSKVIESISTTKCCCLAEGVDCPVHDLTHEDHVRMGLAIEAGRCPCGLPGCSDAAYHRSRGTGAVVPHEHAAVE